MLDVAATLSPPATNKILKALPESVIRRIRRNCAQVSLPAGSVLYHAGRSIEYCYFLNSGLCTLMGSTETGSNVGLGLIGNEGIVGLPAFIKDGDIHHQAIIHISGSAFRISSSVLRRVVGTSGELDTLLLAYMNLVNMQLCQSAICNRFHALRQRLCRWLLAAGNIVEPDDIRLTQEVLSHMLGSSRTAVALSIAELHKEGIIEAGKGRLRIVAPAGLRALSCECYGIVSDETKLFLDHFHGR